VNHSPPVVRFDWAAFAARVERLRQEHATRPQAEAVQRSLEAFARWRVSPPASFDTERPSGVAAPEQHHPATMRTT